MKFETMLFMLLASALLVQSNDLILGDANKRQLIYQTRVDAHAIPYLKRLRYVMYTNPEHTPINAIRAYDNLNSSAIASIISGGMGFTYVHLKFKSERSMGLGYDVGIYS